MSADSQNKLLEVFNKRLEKFVSLLPRVLISDRADRIHDTRVASRRLQQILHVLVPPSGTGKEKKLVRTLRRVRRALGNCRNLDAASNIVQKKIDEAREEAVRAAWTTVHENLREQRGPMLARAREELSECKLMAFISRAFAVTSAAHRDNDSRDRLKQTIGQRSREWSDALDTAVQERTTQTFHRFRIAGKRLRYALELLEAMDDASARSRIKALKKLQDDIGDWHDRQALLQLVADFIGRRDFLAENPGVARTLLTEMDAERRQAADSVASILKNAERLRDSWQSKKKSRPSGKSGASSGAETTPARATLH